MVDAWFSLPALLSDPVADDALFDTVGGLLVGGSSTSGNSSSKSSDGGSLLKGAGAAKAASGTGDDGRGWAARQTSTITGATDEQEQEILTFLYLLYGHDAKRLVEINQRVGNTLVLGDVPDWWIIPGEDPSTLKWVRENDTYQLIVDNGQNMTPPQMAQQYMIQLLASLQDRRVRNQLLAVDPSLIDDDTIALYRQGMAASLNNTKSVVSSISKLYTEGLIELLPGGTLLMTTYHIINGDITEAVITALPAIPDGVGLAKKVADNLPDGTGLTGLLQDAGNVIVTPNRISRDALAEMRKGFNSIRPQAWIEEATKNAPKYTPDQLSRMRAGQPPIGTDGFPMEIHHKSPLVEGGTNDFVNFEFLTRTDHRLGLNYKINHPNLP